MCFVCYFCWSLNHRLLDHCPVRVPLVRFEVIKVALLQEENCFNFILWYVLSETCIEILPWCFDEFWYREGNFILEGVFFVFPLCKRSFNCSLGLGTSNLGAAGICFMMF